MPKHWAKLCQIIGRPELLDDERFIDQRARAINYPELTEELESALAAKTAAEWVELLQEGGLMACLAYTLETGRRHPAVRRERPRAAGRQRRRTPSR